MSTQASAGDVENPPSDQTPLTASQALGSRAGYAATAIGGGAKRVAVGTGQVFYNAGATTVKGVGYVSSNVGDSAKKLGQAFESGYSTSMTWYDKLFLKHVNRAFGDSLEVASRGACFVVVCALPFILPKELCPRCEELIESEYYTGTCIVYFIYTLYLNTGDTIHFAQGGIGGTMMAVFNCWLMQGFMPGGYHSGETMRWWIGSLWGILFVINVLWFNFDDITRIFALSTFVWYWMSFLEPGFNWGFARNFQVRMDGNAFRELTVAFVGCLIAVVAGYFPYPIYAHRKARAVSKAMLEQCYMAKKDFLAYYCGDHPDQMSINVLSAELEAIRAHVTSIPGLLDSAWYESFGYKKWIVQRKLMARLQQYAVATTDRLANVFNICIGETFDDAHIQLMQSIQEPMDRIIDHNAEILHVCLDILFEGASNEAGEAIAQEHIDGAKQAVEDLTSMFQDVRRSLAQQQKKGNIAVGDDSGDIQEVVGTTIAGENIVGITLCKFAEMTRDLYGSLKDITDGKATEQKRTWRKGDGILGIFEPDVLKDVDHLLWVMRNAISIIATFYIGLHGYNKYILSYNASIASTVSVLLSNFAGSACLKNLARLQGVVIGIVLGNLLYALLGWCTWWGHLLVGIVLYFWSLLGLFMYYHSAAYSTVGLLLVVFGTKSLLRRCTNELSDPIGYRNIVDVTVAIVVMTLVDTLLSPARASDLAKKAFREAYVPLVDALAKFFNEDEKFVRRQEGAILALISKAEFLGKEATLEPRFWRCDWPNVSFDKAISCLGSIRFSMNSMEINVLHYSKGKRMKKSEFVRAISLDSFKRPCGVKDLLLMHVKSVMKAVEVSLADNGTHDIFKTRLKKLHELDFRDKESAKRRLAAITERSNLADEIMIARETSVLWSDALDEFSKELNETLPRAQRSKSEKTITEREKSLSEDANAEVCMVVESLRSMFTELDNVFRTICSRGVLDEEQSP